MVAVPIFPLPKGSIILQQALESGGRIDFRFNLIMADLTTNLQAGKAFDRYADDAAKIGGEAIDILYETLSGVI